MKKFFTTSAILLLLIFLLGSFLRFNNLSTNPPSLNWDEVSFAYNAHSIIETGRDEFGQQYPVYFRALDDYKLPVYMYMTVVSEKIFGYTNFAVRFPSAFFGSLTILLVYFFTKQITAKSSLALLSAFLFAILPWHIQFCRMAAESTVGLFLFLGGALLLFSSKDKKLWLLPCAIFVFAIAQYTYLSFRFFIPIYLVLFVLLYYKQLCKRNIYVYISAVLLVLFLGILGFDSYINQNTSRTSGIAAININSTPYQQDVKDLLYDGTLGINIPRKIFHDSHVFSSMDILSGNYLSHFSPQFLFFNMHQERHYTPMFGLVYLWMLPFLLLGIYALCLKYEKTSLLLFGILLLSPLPAAFAFDAPNAIRTVTMSIPIGIITAVGIYFVAKRLSPFLLLSYSYSGILCLIVGFTLFYFYHENTIHLSQQTSQNWQYGRKEMTQYLLANKQKYKKIVLAPNLEWANVFYLYYSHYDPKTYLKHGGTKNGSFDASQNRIENMEFHSFDFSKDRFGKQVLFVGKPDDFPKFVTPLYTISYLDGSPAIYFVESQEKLVNNQSINSNSEIHESFIDR